MPILTGRPTPRLASFLLAVLASCHAPAPAASVHGPAVPPPTLSAAARAFETYDLETSRRLYRGVTTSPSSSREDKAAAHRELGREAWKFDHDADTALREIGQALQLTGEPSLLVERGEIALARGEYDAAIASAEGVLATKSGPSLRANAIVLYAQAAIGESLSRARPSPGVDHAKLRRASALLTEALEVQPGRPAPSEALMKVALLSDDGPSLFRAWSSYFLVAEEETPNPVLRESAAKLRALALTWRDRPLGEGERGELIAALAGSRFYDLASFVADGLKNRPEPVEDIRAYARFVGRVADVNADFYPRIAKGLRHYERAYDAAIELHARDLWAELAHGRPAPFTMERFFALIRDRFGAEGYVGETVGFYGMLLGHIVHDEQKLVEQYGRTAEFRLVMIDRPISRDFTSWYGTTNVGGWATESVMFQARAAYLDLPFRRLAWVSDPEQRAKLEARLATETREDVARCSADPYAAPTSVSLRIQLEESERLYAELKGRRLRGQGLALAFVAESLRLNVEATVFAHEGRHALDQRYFKDQFAAWTDDERELRAKLSEVAFSSNPKLALTGSILGARLDETFGHGLANRRFRILLVDWMDAHRDALGLDPKTPRILQLDRLTNEQLVGIVQAADSMAKDAPAK